MKRIARLVEIQRWKPEEIKPRFDQLRVTDDDLDAILDLLLVPEFPPQRFSLACLGFFSL